MQDQENTYYDKIKLKLKNNPVAAILGIIFIFLIPPIFSMLSIFVNQTPSNQTIINNSNNPINITNNAFETEGKAEKYKAKVLDNIEQKLIDEEFSFQLKKEHKGVKEITVDNQVIQLLNTSTKINPRIQIMNISSLSGKEIRIITNSGDTCITVISNMLKSNPIRIIPNCF
jgi:hypothetical protein